MAITKLVCQGCGANLDVLDDRRIIQCGYCGTNNQIRQTVQPQPAPPPPQPTPPPPQYAPAPPQVSPQRSGVGRALTFLILGIALIPLLIGGFITYFVSGVAQQAIETFGTAIEQAGVGVVGQGYMWISARPYLADVDGDGTDDVLGTIQTTGGQQLELVAISGSSFSTLWKVDLGRRSDLPNPRLHFEPSSKLLLFEIGPALHAYDAGTGTLRWTAALPDKIEMVVLDGEQLWVSTIDDEHHAVSLADGGVSPTADKPGDDATQLRDDGEYDLIPDLAELDLSDRQFDDVRVEQAFCADADLPPFAGRRHSAKSKHCDNPNGLAWVSRSKGTQVPFLIGYERKTKAERWRVQLTKAGSLETVETGFAQPRAEIFGDQAIVSFTPSSDANGNARIRRISLADGATVWETTLTKTLTAHINGMVAGSNRLLVQYGTAMHVLELANGSELSTLGGL